MRPLSRALAAARQTRRFHAFAPADAPADPAEAYAVQAETAAALGASVAGWKVGFAPDRTPIAGPIFDADLIAADAAYRLATGESVLVEVELAFRLRADLPPGRLYSIADIAAAADEWLVGIELVGTRYADPDAAPFAARLADNLNNAAYAAGAVRAKLAGVDRMALPFRLWIDGVLVSEAIGRHPEGDPLAPAAAWASAQADRLGGLRAGQIVTTGALNAPHPLDRAARIEAELDGIGRAKLNLA